MCVLHRLYGSFKAVISTFWNKDITSRLLIIEDKASNLIILLKKILGVWMSILHGHMLDNIFNERSDEGEKMMK